MIRAVMLGAAALVLLGGCFVYDAKPARTNVINDTDEPVAVHLLGGGRVLVFGGTGSRRLTDEECVGQSVVVSGADGEVLAGFDGPVCPNTTVRLFSDGRIVVADDSHLREPLSDPPAVWPQVINESESFWQVFIGGSDMEGSGGGLCVGDEVNIATGSRSLVASYRGGACPGTVVRIRQDGQVEVTDDGVLREPSLDPPRTWKTSDVDP